MYKDRTINSFYSVYSLYERESRETELSTIRRMPVKRHHRHSASQKLKLITSQDPHTAETSCTVQRACGSFSKAIG